MLNIYVFKIHRRCKIWITIILCFLNKLFSTFWTDDYDMKMFFILNHCQLLYMEICHTELSVNMIHNTNLVLKNIFQNQVVILLGKI